MYRIINSICLIRVYEASVTQDSEEFCMSRFVRICFLPIYSALCVIFFTFIMASIFNTYPYDTYLTFVDLVYVERDQNLE